jgi:apolipoprotein N-acyltransferase
VAAHPAALAVLMARVMAAQGAGRALLVGWLWGWGHFAVGNGWIATAFTYQAQMPAWLGWIAVLLLAVYLALFPALAGLMGWWLARRWALAPVPALAACWIVAEWVRGWLFTGFPWNPLAAATLGGFDRPGLARLLPWREHMRSPGWWWCWPGCGFWRWAPRGRGAGDAVWRWHWCRWRCFSPRSAAIRHRVVPFTLVQPNIGQDEINDPPAKRSSPARPRCPCRAIPARAAGALARKRRARFLREGYPRAGMPPPPMAATRCWRARAWAG